ncbi:MAG: hypothetical protein M0R74_16735 [Dehalococcoidia bacterium]|nr:hypothetical protein [Dehalococcoidia bacterium]
MTDRDSSPPPALEHRAGQWARPSEHLHAPPNLSKDDAPNIEGRRPVAPSAGFGQLWEKEYRVQLPVASSAREVTGYWKREFGNLWPPGHRYSASLRGIQPGEVAAVELPVPGGTRLSTGVRVLFSGDTSFTLETSEGHMFAGWIQSSVDGDPGELTARVLVVMRANDPLYELGLRLGGHKREDEFWSHSLRELAEHFGAPPRVSVRHRLIDPKVRWRAIGNVRKNAWLHTLAHGSTLPARRLVRRFRGQPAQEPSDLER